LVARRFETYLAGSDLVLVGVILLDYLSGFSSTRQIPALFLAGAGVIFCVMAVLKRKAPGPKHEMSARATLAYGVIALVIGVLWFSVYLEPQVAEYLLAFLLVFFGVIFLAYTRLK